MTEWHQEALAPLYKWIVDNKEDKNIQFVMELGDITNTDTDFEEGTSAYGKSEWATAYAANIANCASVDTGIRNGGINVDQAVYTVDNLYVYNTVAEGGLSRLNTALPITQLRELLTLEQKH